ncbi:MAG TPA: NAD-dependent protein deacylase [Tetragenococcus sp.]|nr:NAD-dependent protein deacylase [Tetragenococcus sp.]
MTKLNQALKEAKKIVFLTGAGVSTASGIPDYRSKNGLYASGDAPEYLLSQTCLLNEPEKQYEFITHNMIYPAAQPNVIHEKMAALTQSSRSDIITQNVDGLHLKAGTDPKRLVEFHGNIYHIYCTKCGKTASLDEYQHSMHHHNCGGVLRTDIVLYEEAIDSNKIERAVAAISQADLIVVVGTSFVVYPFAGLIQYASADAKMLAVNRQRIQLPANAEMIVGDAVDEFAQVEIN